ncbi:MAG: glycine cleavage system protein GcvH [Sphaerochaeta sp.]|nr:glycine cleavage system protein GcvH [Sphaerochaeta sp.]PKL29435.1 MAG: glycine cleavage system protein H [Spirochaetae bacterium HGW-Spirochaetae-2]HCG64562.1 glycine cleavage system protein GcvH [Sphaerochaeta sp.]
MSRIPSDLRYSKDHEWVRIEGNVAYVGITDYAQDTLGEVVYVELPSVGDSFEANEEIANIESVKAASAIYNPIAGTVAAVNKDLESSPESVNEDSYANYLYTLKDFEASALEDLLDAKGYEAFIATLD